MEQLHYPAELRSFDEVPIEEAEIKKDELKLAKQLIDQAAGNSFEPENYRDEVRERVLELTQRKIDGEDITLAPSEKPEHKIIDIMEALKASLEEVATRKHARRVTEQTPRKTTRKKATAKKRAAK